MSVCPIGIALRTVHVTTMAVIPIAQDVIRAAMTKIQNPQTLFAALENHARSHHGAGTPMPVERPSCHKDAIRYSVREPARTPPPPPQTGLDRKWLHSQSLLYNIGVSALSTHNNSSPSTERCERRAARALGDDLTGATSSGSCPALTSMCWPWSTSSLGPRFARLRGDRRETDARGRAERPSKWRG